ncbi:MAG: LCP family protein, partial [Patescibacteria group bacterium]
MQPKVKRVYLPRLKLMTAIGASVLLVIFLTKIIVWGQRFEKQTGMTPTVLAGLVFDDGRNLKAFDGRTNVLVLGIAGGTHEGADLTDTMMVLSLAKEPKKLVLISIPRDIWSDTLKDKINSAYHYGNEKKPGGGMILAKAIVEDVVGIPIHYGLLIDFSGFKELIDLVGGVKVKVSRSFTDPNFPISGRENDPCQGDPKLACRYETVQFTAGEELMAGERALKYVRSRHAEGEEGSDFARSRRQQEVFVALKDKLVS